MSFPGLRSALSSPLADAPVRIKDARNALALYMRPAFSPEHGLLSPGTSSLRIRALPPQALATVSCAVAFGANRFAIAFLCDILSDRYWEPMKCTTNLHHFFAYRYRVVVRRIRRCASVAYIYFIIDCVE